MPDLRHQFLCHSGGSCAIVCTVVGYRLKLPLYVVFYLIRHAGNGVGVEYTVVKTPAIEVKAMQTSTAPTGKMAKGESINLHAFTRAFIAGLVARDWDSIRPQNPSDRRGFARVVQLLDESVADLKERQESSRRILDIARIANDLRPSNSGAFDGFEAALRSMQLTLASCPNPFYEDIVFSVPKSYAQATIDDLPVMQRELIEKAVDAFVSGAGASRP